MSPPLTMNDFGNSSTINRIAFCNLENANPGSVETSDFPNVILGENGHCRALTPRKPSFFSAVSHVFQLSACKKMLRIHAASIVAAVKNAVPFRNSAVVNLVGKSVRHSTVSVIPEIPVPVLPLRARPQPALTQVRDVIRDWSVFINFGPESWDWVNHWPRFHRRET